MNEHPDRHQSIREAQDHLIRSGLGFFRLLYVVGEPRIAVHDLNLTTILFYIPRRLLTDHETLTLLCSVHASATETGKQLGREEARQEAREAYLYDQRTKHLD